VKYYYSYSLNSGIPLGGIGAGSIELRADGRIHEWLIFNNGEYASRTELRGRKYLDPDSFLIAVKVQDGEKTVIRLLRSGEYYYGASPYTLPWVRPVKAIEYTGEYPFATLKYIDDELNNLVDIEAEAFSPFIPGDLKNSSLPAALMNVRIRNKTNRVVRVSIVAAVKSPSENSRATIFDDGVSLEPLVTDGVDPLLNGSLHIGFFTRPGDGTGVLRRGGLVIPNRHPMSTYYNECMGFVNLWVKLRSGEIEGGHGVASGRDLWGVVFSEVEVKPGRDEVVVLALSWFFPNHIDEAGDKLGHYYENYFNNARSVYEYLRSNYRYLYEKTREFHDLVYDSKGIEPWVADLASSQLSILVKSTWLTRRGEFAIWESIRDPYYTGPDTAMFNTLDVVTYVLPSLTVLFPELAVKYIEYVSQFSLSRDSPLYLVYALAYPENKALFIEEFKKDPSIVSDYRRMLEVVWRIVDKTGKDPAGRPMHTHRFSIKGVDAYHMVDLMPKLILASYIVSKWTGDHELLRKLLKPMEMAYNAVVKGQSIDGVLPYHTYPAGFDWYFYIQAIAAQLGLVKPPPLENFASIITSIVGERALAMGFQTFDVWSFYGYSAYTSILWLASLKALEDSCSRTGECIPEIYREKYGEAVRRVYEKLWNGRYFRLWHDPLTGFSDEACMAAQLLGQWLAWIAGLGYVVDEDKVRLTLQSIYSMNLVEGEGLLNGVYPSRLRPADKGPILYDNPLKLPLTPTTQMDTPWTGVEFMVASHMLYEGMVDEALRILRIMHDRYTVSGMYWNHIEWGARYTRSLASWSVILGILGLRYDGFSETLTLSPAIKPIEMIITVPGAWGKLSYTGEAFSIQVRHGKLCLRRLVLATSGSSIKEVKSSKPVEYEASASPSGVTVEFHTELCLGEGDYLEVLF